MSTPLLSVRGVKTFYGRVQALKGVDLDVNDGEIVTLIGANGAGKSTLMMTICGNPRARDGAIVFAGQRHHAHADARDRAPQARAGAGGPPHLLAHDGAGKPADGRDRRRAGAFRRATLSACSALFPRLKQRLGQRGGTLSGGEQQMLAIARALMSRPRLLLLDEPSLGLAPLIVRQIFDAIRKLNARRRPDGLPGRAERLSRAQARPPRLRHGQWADHAVRQRARIARAPGGQIRLSRRRQAAIRWQYAISIPELLYEEGSFGVFLLVRSSSAAGRRRSPAAPSPRPGGRPGRWSAYMFVLGGAVRFFHFALFDGTLLSLHYYLVDSAGLPGGRPLGFRADARRQMVTQYRWINEPQRADALAPQSRPDVTSAQAYCASETSLERGTRDEQDHIRSA